MNRILKDTLRKLLIFFHLDLTKNLRYDRLTKKIMKKNIKSTYNCIDIGCHKGEILDMMLQYAPQGKHFAFEPIPYLFAELERDYKNRSFIFPYALSNKNGHSTFQFVKNAPAYSGIKKRRYDVANIEIEEIQVEVKMLDDVIPSNEKIDFIKIDVEGGEFDVIKGAKNTLKKNKPLVLFECGLGASDYYDTNILNFYNFITNEIGLKIFTLKSFLKNTPPLTLEEFENHFNSNTEYYFAAAPYET